MNERCRNNVFKLDLGDSKIVKLRCNRKTYTKKSSLVPTTLINKSKRKYKTI